VQAGHRAARGDAGGHEPEHDEPLHEAGRPGDDVGGGEFEERVRDERPRHEHRDRGADGVERDVVEPGRGGDEPDDRGRAERGEEGHDGHRLAEPPEQQADDADEGPDPEGEEDRPPRAAEHHREARRGQGVAEHPGQGRRRPGALPDAPDAGRDRREGDGAVLESEHEPVGAGRLPEGELDALGVDDGGGTGRGLADDDERGQDTDREAVPDPSGVAGLLERQAHVRDAAAGVEEQGAEGAEQHADGDGLAVDHLDVRLRAPERVTQVRQCAPDPDHQGSVPTAGAVAVPPVGLEPTPRRF
jgi:hypothetical protein